MGVADYHKVPAGAERLGVPEATVAYASATAIPAPSSPRNETSNDPHVHIAEAPPQQKREAAGTCYDSGDDSTFSRKPMPIPHCPHCNTAHSRTRTRTYSHWKTWVAVGAVAIVFWPLFWLPLVIDEMKQTDHFCVKCGAKVGEVGPFEDCCVTTSE